jgi:hypothetical protein
MYAELTKPQWATHIVHATHEHLPILPKCLGQIQFKRHHYLFISVVLAHRNPRRAMGFTDVCILRDIDGQLYNGLCVCNRLSGTQLPDRSYGHYPMGVIILPERELWNVPIHVGLF